jgi:hypothetical protein
MEVVLKNILLNISIGMLKKIKLYKCLENLSKHISTTDQMYRMLLNLYSEENA